MIDILRGLASSGFFVLNTIFWCLFLLPWALLKACAPSKKFRLWCTEKILWVAEKWVAWNSLNIQVLQKGTRWDLRIPANLNPNRSYLVCVNHQSWTDILALQFLLNRKIPFMRFFLKQQLLYVPFLGLAWWALDYPFMKRHSREYLKKHPEKKGEDLATTRKALEAFRHSPVSILNFLEGTRFSQEKHLAQHSPYQHLLLAKSGGFAFALGMMGNQFDAILDVTIVYPQGVVSFWQAFCGRMSSVVMDVVPLEIPSEFLKGDYLNDEEFRPKIQSWLNELWQKKDQKISKILNESLK